MILYLYLLRVCQIQTMTTFEHEGLGPIYDIVSFFVNCLYAECSNVTVSVQVLGIFISDNCCLDANKSWERALNSWLFVLSDTTQRSCLGSWAELSGLSVQLFIIGQHRRGLGAGLTFLAETQNFWVESRVQPSQAVNTNRQCRMSVG